MDPRRLIQIAAHLAAGGIGRGRGRPNQTDLRRAISSAYYALFHTVAFTCANLIAGGTVANRSQGAWLQTYRSLEHRHIKHQIANNRTINQFPRDIFAFAQHLVQMQDLRHSADYDPSATFLRTEVVQLVQETERAIKLFNGASKPDQRAFGIYVALRSRGN